MSKTYSVNSWKLAAPQHPVSTRKCWSSPTIHNNKYFVYYCKTVTYSHTDKGTKKNKNLKIPADNIRNRYEKNIEKCVFSTCINRKSYQTRANSEDSWTDNDTPDEQIFSRECKQHTKIYYVIIKRNHIILRVQLLLSFVLAECFL